MCGDDSGHLFVSVCDPGKEGLQRLWNVRCTKEVQQNVNSWRSLHTAVLGALFPRNGVRKRPFLIRLLRAGRSRSTGSHQCSFYVGGFLSFPSEWRGRNEALEAGLKMKLVRVINLNPSYLFFGKLPLSVEAFLSFGPEATSCRLHGRKKYIVLFRSRSVSDSRLLVSQCSASESTVNDPA